MTGGTELTRTPTTQSEVIITTRPITSFKHMKHMNDAATTLKAITLNAVWQYKEEKMKGSLEAGKLADLVILDNNPLTVDPLTIKGLKGDLRGSLTTYGLTTVCS